MERNREARRASIVGSNGFNRRRHRTNSLRDSPDEDGGVELQESVRLRDRVKKDRDRERERDRDRERERERDRERERERDLRERSSRSKRRRAERLMNNREDIGGDETSEESVNDDVDDEDEENTSTTGVRLLPPAGSMSNHHHHSNSSSLSQQQNTNSTNNVIGSNHHLQHRKSFPPGSSSKVFRAAPVWKPGDEIISVSVPRKARSACTKRSHDWISNSSNNNGGGGAAGGEQILRQASTSPVRQGLVSTSTPSPSPAAPMSPSSSNAFFRKKLKPSGNNIGPTPKPPKASSKPSSSNPEELEIEIAEVLYGLMTQSQGPSSKKEDSREVNRSNSDAKSRVSSPISNSTSANNQILGPNSSPLQAVAPKRKRPRQVVENSTYGARISPISAKLEMDQTPKTEISSPNLEKTSGSTAENGFVMGGNSVNSQGQPVPPPEPTATESMDSEFKPVAEELRESRDLFAKEDVSSPKEKESSAVRNEDSICMDSTSIATVSVADTMIKANSMVPEVETQREQKFEIDLMAPPPQVRSSPERETKIHLRAATVDQKPVLSIVDAELKPVVSKDEDEKGKSSKEHSANVAAEERKGKGTGEEAESKKETGNKGRNIDLQFDLEKPERNGNAGVNATGNKLQQQQEMPLKANREEPLTEKSGQSKNSLPLPMPMPMASWPGGLPPMGYMAPLQGVVSMDGSTVTPAPIQPLFSQPRPRRCATHCYIARNIHCLQQIMKMNPFWQAAAGSASLFGSKPCNLNVMPEQHGNMAGRGLNNAQDKAPSLDSSPNHGGKDKGSQTASTSDSAQRKQQILIQQALPPVAPSNLLGPAFIFPLNQQQAAVAAASARPSSIKSPSTTGSMASSNPSSSAGASASAAAAGVATAMSFNYPTMAANDTQYLAILQNNAYPFPIPAVGAPPNYRGTPAQAMPLFNGSFYSPQMIHTSHLQHQQTPSTQSPQLQQAHQNASVSSSSLASQKHLLSHQQRPQSSGGNGGAGSANLHNFPSQKSQSSQQLQQSNNQHVHPSRQRHLESELGSEDSPPITDSRGSRASLNIYGQNFAMPIHPQNFALMTAPAALASAAPVSGSSNQSERKPQHPQQSLPPHSFAMSFGPINGTNTGSGIDITSMAQNHAIFQSFPEAARQNIQMMAAAAAAAQVAQKKNFRMSEDDKSGGGDSSATDVERKSLVARAQGGVGQSIAYTRSDLADAPVSTIQANSVIESSGRSLNVASGTARSSRPATTNAMGAINVPNVHIQGQLQQQQMLQLKQQQQQQLAATAVSRSKAPVTSNGSIFSEHLNSSSIMAAKFPNAHSGFPQNLVQSNSSSPTQSPQWKSSTRTPTSQAPSSLVASSTTTLRNLSQQHSRTPSQMHTQISFGGNQKPSTTSQGQAPPSSNQAPSPPMMVGSPTTSSISKGASGSPRTTSTASTNTKMGQSQSLSTQQPKNSSSIPSQKSLSILGNPHVASSSSSGPKPPMQQQSQPQQQQQQLPKTMQQAQLFFSNPYSQAQSPHSTSTSSTTSGPSGFYTQRRRPDQHQQSAQQPPGVLSTSSTGVLTLCPPVTLASTSTNDPAKAIAAATSNVKGGGLPSQGIIHAAQFAPPSAGTLLPAGFSYVHPVPAAVQVKPAEQKQPAGNDNLHTWQPEKK